MDTNQAACLRQFGRLTDPYPDQADSAAGRMDLDIIPGGPDQPGFGDRRGLRSDQLG